MRLMQEFAVGGIVILMGLFLGIFIYRLFRRMIRRNEFEHIWLKILKRVSIPLLLILLSVALTIVFPADRMENLPINFKVLVTIVFNTLISWLVIIAIQSIRLMVMARYDLTTKNNLKARKIHTQLVVIERIFIVLVVLIAFSVTLLSFPKIRQIGVSLLASAGIAGIIIGFAAQRSIAMFLAGFQIALTQPIRLDDVVIVEGEWGWIEEITLTYVVIRIWDKRRLIVPITYFIEKPFQNWTRTSAQIMGTVFIYVDYGFPVDEMRDELTRILKEAPEWDGEVNVLQVTNATEKTMELRALMSSVDSPTNWDLRVKVREGLIRFIEQHYPHYFPQSRIDIAGPSLSESTDPGTKNSCSRPRV